MNPTLQIFTETLLTPLNIHINEIVIDSNAIDYNGYQFTLNLQLVIFRTSKTTPTKIGQFVTFYKRNELAITEPFHNHDVVEYYIIWCEKDSNKGVFIFPKSALLIFNILSSANKEGKRAFRVYPDWDIPNNRQATKTQSLQSNYFINLNTNPSIYLSKFDQLFHN